MSLGPARGYHDSSSSSSSNTGMYVGSKITHAVLVEVAKPLRAVVGQGSELGTRVVDAQRSRRVVPLVLGGPLHGHCVFLRRRGLSVGGRDLVTMRVAASWGSAFVLFDFVTIQRRQDVFAGDDSLAERKVVLRIICDCTQSSGQAATMIVLYTGAHYEVLLLLRVNRFASLPTSRL
jgi:hypothetical protein